MTRRPAAIMAVLVTLATLCGCTGSGEEPDTTPTESSSARPAVDDDRGGQPVSCPPDAGSGQDGDEQQAVRVARCAVVAYTEFSWRDEDHRAFLDRFAPYATDALAAELRELFGEEVPAETAAWEELAAARTVQRTIVLDSDPARDGEGWTVSVEVDTERRTEADDEWEPYGDPRTYRITLVPGGTGWLVADIT